MNNSPYTVPEGFFEKAESNAVAAAKRISSRRKMLAGSICTCAALALIFVLRTPEHKIAIDQTISAEYTDEEILETYDYDIFLNNF